MQPSNPPTAAQTLQRFLIIGLACVRGWLESICYYFSRVRAYEGSYCKSLQTVQPSTRMHRVMDCGSFLGPELWVRNEREISLVTVMDSRG